MNLPPGFLDDLRTRTSLSQVVGRKVTWDPRKSNPGKGDLWAPCPFHQEKSPSFHVDDRKGFYYCFGCHAKGDAVTFVKETENVSFIEAVEILAREAGMAMPERDLIAAEKADRRTELSKVMEEAFKWFRLQLNASAASDARAYIAKRGLTQAAQDRWEIGYAPDQRQGLFLALTQKGIAPDLIVDAGLCARPDDGGPPYDRFRGRIIFPIRDGRGKAISLGGRAMDPNARAKYLNGPETVLFDKGRSLFNHAPAREAAGKGQPLIVAEGYMDVIALIEAGFKSAVAPLGTAVTEDQLKLMWRISDEPIIALDGDKAGISAALRVVDLALPLLESGKGLRFAILPGGQDPDDLIKAHGPIAMQKVLDQAQPMVNLLWQRETEGRSFDSPERRAALDKTLRGAIARITDPSIRTHYGEAIKSLTQSLFRNRSRTTWQPNRRAAYVKGKFQLEELPPLATTKASILSKALDGNDEILQEDAILAILVSHPTLIVRFESELERIDLHGDGRNLIRKILLSHMDPTTLVDRLQRAAPEAIEELMSHPHVRSAPYLRGNTRVEDVEPILQDALNKVQSARASRREVSDAIEDIDGPPDERLTWRVTRSNQGRFDAEAGPKGKSAETVVAPNGITLDKDELEKARKLRDSIQFDRSSRKP